MNTLVALVTGPITPETEARVRTGVGSPQTSAKGDGDAGARLRFEGVVRRIEEGRALFALDYQTYDPMAQRELESLARGVGGRHGLTSILALHSRGRVGVGETSFVLEVTAPRRAEAFAATAEFIERLKQDVPIWKRPVWAP